MPPKKAKAKSKKQDDGVLSDPHMDDKVSSSSSSASESGSESGRSSKKNQVKSHDSDIAATGGPESPVSEIGSPVRTCPGSKTPVQGKGSCPATPSPTRNPKNSTAVALVLSPGKFAQNMKKKGTPKRSPKSLPKSSSQRPSGGGGAAVLVESCPQFTQFVCALHVPSESLTFEVLPLPRKGQVAR